MNALRRLGPFKRLAAGAVVLGLAAATLVAYLPRPRAMALRFITEASAYPSEHWFAFALGQVLIAACGVLPASIMAVLAGAAYGMAGGFAISVVCTMLGGWLAFLLSRSVLRPWIERIIARSRFSENFDAALEGEGWRFVFLLRISPVMPFALTSYGFGLTRIRQSDYLLGTLASLPALASYVALGAVGRQGMTLSVARASPVQWALLAIGVVAMIMAVAKTRAIMQRIAGK